MKYQYVTGCGCASSDQYSPNIIQGPQGPPGPPGEGQCSINAYGGLYNSSNISVVLVANAQTVISTLGYMPNMNIEYVGSAIKIDVEGDYEVNLTVVGADLATSLTVFIRKNGVPIPATSVTKDLQVNVSETFTSNSIIHLDCGDVLDIGIQSGIAGAMIIPQNSASLIIKKLDTQVCCDCIRKYKEERECCHHCPKASHEIKTCKDSC